MEKVVICCLKGVTEKVKKHRIIPLDKENEVIIGRAPGITISIPSSMISRKHVILNKQDDKWRITDNKSLNGVFINGIKLEANVPQELRDGDIVQLGVPSEPDSNPDFVWKFLMHCKVKKIKAESVSEEKTLVAKRSDSQASDSSDIVLTQQPRKRCSNLSPVKEAAIAGPSPSKRQRLSTSPPWSPSRELQQKLHEQDLKAQEKLAEQAAKLEELQAQLQQKDRMQEKMMAELCKKEEEMKSQLTNQREELAEQKRILEEEVKQNYEREIKEKEDKLLSRLSQEKERLLEEKRLVEDNLQKEMERKLEKKDKDLENKLRAEKDKLDRVIEQREVEHLLLLHELDDSRTLAKQEQENVLKAKEDILTNFTELMETELQCSICNEMFVRATSLNCSHSFCSMCIAQWMDVKKECPVCRAKITSNTRSLVLDSYIERMTDHLTADLKKRREDLVKQRKEEMAAREAAAAARNAGSSTSGRGGRGRGRGRRGGRGGRRNTVVSAPIVVESGSSDVEDLGSENRNSDDEDNDNSDNNDSEIMLSDSMNSSYNDHEDSDSSLEGDPHAFYGGYGHCFTCGRRGHWAHGCIYS